MVISVDSLPPPRIATLGVVVGFPKPDRLKRNIEATSNLKTTADE